LQVETHLFGDVLFWFCRGRVIIEVPRHAVCHFYCLGLRVCTLKGKTSKYRSSVECYISIITINSLIKKKKNRFPYISASASESWGAGGETSQIYGRRQRFLNFNFLGNGSTASPRVQSFFFSELRQWPLWWMSACGGAFCTTAERSRGENGARPSIVMR